MRLKRVLAALLLVVFSIGGMAFTTSAAQRRNDRHRHRRGNMSWRWKARHRRHRHRHMM